MIKLISNINSLNIISAGTRCECITFDARFSNEIITETKTLPNTISDENTKAQCYNICCSQTATATGIIKRYFVNNKTYNCVDSNSLKEHAAKLGWTV